MKLKGILVAVLILACMSVMAACFQPPLFYDVDFLNYDGSIYQTVKVQRHRDASAINLPDAKSIFVDANGQAYTADCSFLGWLGDLTNVTEDRQIAPSFTKSNISYETFIVVFMDTMDNVISTQYIEKGGDAVAPELVPPEGQMLLWDTPFTNVRSNLTVRALFVFTMMDFVFDAGQGAFANGDKEIVFSDVDYFQPIDENSVEVPSLEHHDFARWVKTIEQNGKVLRFTANYDVHTFNVTFRNYNQNAIIAVVSVAYGASALPVAPVAPAREGYTFVEWAGADLTFIVGDTEVYAVYLGRDVIYSFYGFNNQLLYTYTVPYGSVSVNPVAPEIDGYTFIEWRYSEIDKSGSVWRISATAHYMYGVFYKVAFTVNGMLLQAQLVEQGSAAVDPFSISGVDYSVIPEGYEIIGWVTDSYDQEGNLISVPFDFSTPVSRNMTVRAVLREIAP